jgi:hypothetical protein
LIISVCICGKRCNKETAHLHGDGWIGDECCWDERLKSSGSRKKVIDYVDEQKYTVVPRKRMITDYKDIVRVDIVPR